MALLLGDIHGNLDKALAFLDYKPEEKHVFVGDYVDSFEESEERILLTLKAVLESDAELLLGNHDLHYFSERPFTCSGYNYYRSKDYNQIFEAHLDRWKPAIAVDGLLVTHGGISEGFGNSLIKTKNVDVACEKINSEWKAYLEGRFNRKPNEARVDNKLFYISHTRGGRNGFAGPFWADYRTDKLYGINQAFGHSRTQIGEIINVGWRDVECWALGCDNDRRICFNTTTRQVEDFTHISNRGYLYAEENKATNQGNESDNQEVQ
jgi:hypothetical protein